MDDSQNGYVYIYIYIHRSLEVHIAGMTGTLNLKTLEVHNWPTEETQVFQDPILQHVAFCGVDYKTIETSIPEGECQDRGARLSRLKPPCKLTRLHVGPVREGTERMV